MPRTANWRHVRKQSANKAFNPGNIESQNQTNPNGLPHVAAMPLRTLKPQLKTLTKHTVITLNCRPPLP